MSVRLAVNIGTLREAIKEAERLAEIAEKQKQVVLGLSCTHAIIALESLIGDLKDFKVKEGS